MKSATATLVLLAALVLSACGGGGGETSASSTTATSPPARSAAASGSAAQGQSPGQRRRPAKRQAGGVPGVPGVPGDTSAHFAPPAHHDSPSGAAQFEVKAGDNSIEEFGSEAGSSDFAAAATALHGYLDARAASAWRDACSYMAPAVAASLAQLIHNEGDGGGPDCPETLASLSSGVSAAALREAAVAKVAALRADGAHAFLLLRGAGGTAYFMPMASESGAWKVAALAPSALQ